MIIAGGLAVFACVMAALAVMIYLSGDFTGSDIVSSDVTVFAMIGVAISLCSGIFQFFTGFYSKKNINNPEKINTFIHLGSIVAFLAIVSQIWDVFNSNLHAQLNDFVVLLGIVIPAFYIISAIQLKSKEEIRHERIAELSAFENFFVRNKERIFEILFTLIICGMIGWLIETTEVFIRYGRLTARGMLFISRIDGFPIVWGLPFILMYGVGGSILIWAFKPLAKEPIRLFLVGTFVLTLFEYATSLFCETAFNMKLWDYSHMFMNFQGRICLSSSLAWGVLSVISVKFLAPLFDKLYNKIMNKRTLHIIIIVLLVFIIVCYILRPYLNVEQY